MDNEATGIIYDIDGMDEVSTNLIFADGKNKI